MNLVTQLTAEQARLLTDKAKTATRALWTQLLDLYAGGAHLSLGYASWADYCAAEFNMSDAQAYRLLDAARVVAQLPMGSSPVNERQARELAPLLNKPEKLQEVWKQALEESNGHPTARSIRKLRQPQSPGIDKSRVAVKERRQQIISMGRDQYKPQQIANALGIGEAGVNRVLREAGVVTVGERLGHTRRIDANGLMDSVLETAMPPELALTNLYGLWHELDRKRFSGWRQQLRAIFQTFRKMGEKMDKEMK